MVCKVVDGVLCIVRDYSGRSTLNKFTSEFAPDIPVRKFIIEVANHFSYEPDSIELTLQKPDNDIVLSDKTEGSLLDAGINTEPGSRNAFSLTGHGSHLPILRVSPAGEDDLSLGASASPTAGSSDYPPAPPLPPPLSSSSSATPQARISEFYSTNYSSPSLIKHDTGYVGLVNQAMTCYLNSLLQALYMTPEFRNALYKWEFDGNTNETKSIPFQLQKLFLNLQTSNRNAVETTELTRSFGWDSSEAWQQHDIQELCRVMFDALEQVLKDTQQADLIDRLYQGKMIDYVKCLECGQEKSRQDTFLDIPLPVRPFGSNVAYGSVEEALRAFVQPETLEGNNQYHCDQCAKKCNAHKGLKFSKFPYLLTLHLKRFDFDYNTMHRIKLNDKVVFPEILDLNSFIQQDKDEGSEGIPEEMTAGKCDDSSTTDSGSALDDGESCQGATNELLQSDNTVQEDDEGIDVSGGSSTGGNNHENEKNRQHTMQKGPYLYELFSIMIHSGSASGGHYYAYIKDFSNGEWFCFNDQTVTRITNDDITKTYGGGAMRGYYSGAYSSSTNAYMLMYRQIDKDRNCEAITVEEFPPHIKELYKRLQEREENDRRMKEQELEMCKIKLYCYPFHPFQSNNSLFDAKLYCSNDMTLREATEYAYKTLKLEGVVPIEQCRLVSYNKLQDVIEVSFEGKEDEPIVDILNGLRSTHRYDLLMEIRNKNQKFMEYQPGGITLRVFVVDLETEEVDGPTPIRGNVSLTIGELKEIIGTTLNMDSSQMILLYAKYSDLSELNECSRTLRQEGVHSLTKIFVCDSPSDTDPEMTVVGPKIRKIVERFENTITLHIVLPDTSPETLSSLSIPMLNSPSAISTPSINVATLTTNNDTPATTNNLTSENTNRQRRSGTSELKKGNNCVGVGSLPSAASGGTGDTGGGNIGVGSSSLPIGTGGTGDSGGGGGGGSRTLLLPLPLTSSNSSSTCTMSAVGAPDNVIVSAAASVAVMTASATTTVTTAMLAAPCSTCSTSSMMTEAEETGSQGAGGGDQSTSEDSSLTDSDRTLIGDVPDDYPSYNHTDVMCTTGNNEYELSSPAVTESSKFISVITELYEIDNNILEDDCREEEDVSNKFMYFKAAPYTNAENDQKMLKVLVDKRMLLGYLKTSLEPYVGVPAVYFRIYRMYPGQQEYECTLLKDALTVYKDNEQLSIKLGRALRGGEYRVKVYQLIPDAVSPSKFLCDWIIAKGQTVSETKRELLEDLNKKDVVKIPLDRCRLRKKNWKSPVKPYLDNEVWGYDITLESNTDIFLQELPGPEIVKDASQLLLFIRQWHPSNYQLGCFQEIVMDGRSISELKTKISEISDIPLENVEFAKPPTTAFPCEVSVLVVHDLDWNHSVETIDQWPLQISEDGSVIFFRDSREELKQLTPEERKEIASKESAKRTGPTSGISSYSPRKERPLKIYLDSTPRRPRAIVEPDID